MIVFVYILAFLKNAIYGVSVFFTGKLVASTDVFDVLALRFLMSWVVFELLKQTKIGIVFLLLAIVSGALYMVLATGMNNFALGRIKTSTMSAFGGISTLVTIAAGVFLNGEELYTYHYIGITLIIVRMLGVCYLASKNSQSAK